jgi:hypothetical protein
MVYDSSLFGDFEQNIFANPPYLQSTTLTAAPFDSVAGGTKFVNTSPLALRAAPVTDATPYVQSYSLDVQQELPGQFMLDIGYFGSKDTHLLGIVDINQPLPGAYATAGLTDRSGKPITAGTLTSANIYAINAIRPYAGFDAINAIEPWFSSNYNSLQASVQKRFKGGSLISVNYTWSHSLTDNQTDRSTAPQNTYCIQCEYGPSQLDRRNVLTANFVYNLPFFQAQHGTVGHVLGGWEMSGIIAANSGLPLTVTTSSTLDPAGQGVKDGNSVSGPRPNQIGDPNSGAPQTRLNWFNTGAFQNVAAGQLTPGTERRGAVLGPGFWRADLSLFKNIRLTERFSAQFRAEAFNVFNHTNFDGVGTNISTTSTFGQITSARDPRIMQLALKFYF